jgi:hypothetical protein
MTNFTFDPEQREAIGGILDERMELPISIEVWARKDGPIFRTDRPPCPHCEDTLHLARMLASLHPGLTVTYYDMDKFEKRAAEAGIERPPFTIIRGRNGRDVRLLGFWTGALFPAIVDVVTYVSREESPYSEESRAVIAAIDRDIDIHVYGTIYDGFSAQMLRMGGALASESRHLRFQFTELAEFPDIALQHEIDSVPVTVIDGRRFLGVWDEPSLVRQISHIAAGRPDIVAPPEPQVVPFYSEADLERMAAQNAAQQAATPPMTEGGLYLPR